MHLHPYKNGSNGARELANALGIKQIKREHSKFKGREDKLVINWGSTTMDDEVRKCAVLNKPEAVAVASNKLSFFEKIAWWNNQATTAKDIIHYPQFTTSMDGANRFMRNKSKVVCRTVLNGHSGEGIVIASTLDELVHAPLYTLYIPKKQEYRIHVMGDKVVDVQRKARAPDVPDDQVDWQVRNHANGFIFVRDEEAQNVKPEILHHSVLAVKACGLDFGAVDVIFNEKTNRGYLLEINTAPGLTGATLEGYNTRFKELEAVFKARDPNKRVDFVELFGNYALDNALGEAPIPPPAAPPLRGFAGHVEVNWNDIPARRVAAPIHDVALQEAMRRLRNPR